MMTRLSLFLALACLSIGLVFSTGACGSGGAAAPVDPNAALVGTFFFGNFEGEAAPEQSTTSWGSIVADGAGTLMVTAQNNTDGAIGPTVVPPVPYVVGPGLTLALQVGAPGVDTHRGGLSADGRLGVIASVLAGEDPTLVFFTKREGAFSNGSLVGVYHVCQVFDSIAGVNGDGAFWGTATFNGAGGVTYSIGVNNDGTVPVGPVPIVSTYAVAADGALTLPISGSDFTGGVLAGGEIAFACGGESGGDVRALTVFVKQAAAASAATFSGPYHMAALEADVAPVPIPHWSTLVGEASADGAGTLTLASAAALGDHGLVTVLPPGITQPYTVAVDGTMTLATAVSLRGGITADGRFAVLAGGSVNTEDVQLFLFVR